MIKEHDPVIIEETIAGSLEVGALSGGAKKGEKGFVVDILGTSSDPAGYTVEVIVDEEGRGRLVDVEPGQVRLDWQAYWTAERIQRLRSQLGKTQKEMGSQIWAGSLATARKNLANLERGATRPSASVARTLERLEESRQEVRA